MLPSPSLVLLILSSSKTSGSVFRTDLNDPALLNAVKLTFAFAVTGGNVDQECLDYQSRSDEHNTERIGSPETALSLPTLGLSCLPASR